MRMMIIQILLFQLPKEFQKIQTTLRGIILGATGEGEAVTANRFPHIRAVAYYGQPECVVDDEADIILRSREHNNSNILSLGARYLTEEEMMSAVNLWLNTPFTYDERHVRRLAKIDEIKIE